MITEIDTGDVVHHTPSGEDWLVARVDGNKLAWMGYPPGWANLADCTLQEKAKPEWRDKMLSDIANSGHHCSAWAKERITCAAASIGAKGERTNG